jgi:hypothetical protein
MENEHIDQLRKDLLEIKTFLKVISARAVIDMLSEVATTPERQQMWRLADGEKSNEEISKQVGVSLRAVQYFVQETEGIGLIVSERRGYPKRIEDVFPKDWKPWKPSKEKTAQPTTEIVNSP